MNASSNTSTKLRIVSVKKQPEIEVVGVQIIIIRIQSLKVRQLLFGHLLQVTQLIKNRIAPMTFQKFAKYGLFGISIALSGGTATAETKSTTQVFEIITTHCNDVLFKSDGAGVSACIEAGLRYNEWQFGYGLYGVTPERKNGGVLGDNVRDLARFTVGFGQFKHTTWNGISGDYAIQGRVGLEGGVIDDISSDLQKAIHKLFGAGFKTPTSTKKTTFIGGLSGWARADGLQFSDDRVALKFQPYVHASVGFDTVEAGGGLLIAFQPTSAKENMAMLMPKNGSYLTTFGGDGFGIFGAARVVARETLYSRTSGKLLGKPVVFEFGTVAQYTAFDKIKLGWSASCTSKAYKGAPKADCKTEARLGYIFSSL